METHHWIGVALVAAGLSEIAFGFLFLPARVPERNRQVVTSAVAAGGFTVLVIGVLFLLGILGAPAAPSGR